MVSRTPFAVLLSMLAIAALPALVFGGPVTITQSGSGNGINSGFGDRIGTNSSLALSSQAPDVSNPSGLVNWALSPSGGTRIDNSNAVVIYIDTTNGASGFSSTSSLTDTGGGSDQLREATSATNGTVRADINFAPTFKADYAIAMNNGVAVVYQLATPSLAYKGIVSTSGYGASGSDPYQFSTSFAQLGLSYGDSFRYVATYLDPVNTNRSNEFMGVASGNASIPADPSNVGQGTVTLASGDFNTFNSVAPEPSSLSLLAVGGLLCVRRRRAQ